MFFDRFQKLAFQPYTVRTSKCLSLQFIFRKSTELSSCHGANALNSFSDIVKYKLCETKSILNSASNVQYCFAAKCSQSQEQIWPRLVYCIANKYNCCKQACDYWAAWGSWSACSESCGRGERSRSRECSNGVAGTGGCLGKSSVSEVCVEGVSSDKNHVAFCAVPALYIFASLCDCFHSSFCVKGEVGDCFYFHKLLYFPTESCFKDANNPFVFARFDWGLGAEPISTNKSIVHFLFFQCLFPAFLNACGCQRLLLKIYEFKKKLVHHLQTNV